MLKFPNIRTAIVALILLSATTILYPQNLVGLREPDIVKYMKANMQNYSIDKDIVNSIHKYLKYSTGDGMQTLLVFFNDKGYCKEVRLSLDRSLYSTKVRELDSAYTKMNNSEWLEKKGRHQYRITLTDDKWYYTLKITEKK